MATLDLDTFLDGLPTGEAQHLAGLFDAWTADPKSVAAGWGALFGALSGGGLAAGTGAAPASQASVRAATTDSIRALMLIRAYRVRGHLEAKLDPLGLTEVVPHPELDPKS